MGRWIRHSGWYPNFRQPQLFRRGAMAYTLEPVHEGYRLLTDQARSATLRHAIWQFPVRRPRRGRGQARTATRPSAPPRWPPGRASMAAGAGERDLGLRQAPRCSSAACSTAGPASSSPWPTSSRPSTATPSATSRTRHGALPAQAPHSPRRPIRLNPPIAQNGSANHMLHRRTVLAGAAGAFAVPAWAQFRVEISGVGATQLPIAIVRFRDEDRAPQSRLGHRPRRPRAQRRLPHRRRRAARSTRPAQPAMAEWRGRAADALVAGSVDAPGRRPLRRALQALGRGQGQPSSAARAAPCEAADLRLAAHRIADYIYEKLTGEKGVFSTRIAYVTKGGGRYTLRVADADGEGGQVALNSAEPIISPAWSPNGTRARLRVVREPEGGGLHPGRRHRQPPRGRQLPRLEQRAGLVARRPDAGGDAVARRRLAALPDRPQRREPAPPDDQPGDRHRAGVRARRPQRSTSSATAAAARRSTASPAAAARSSASPSAAATTSARRSAPTGARSPTSRAPATRSGCTRRTSTAGAQPIALTDTSDDESPSFAPNGRLIIYATRAQGRDVLMTTTLDGKIKARLRVRGQPTCASRRGGLTAADLPAVHLPTAFGIAHRRIISPKEQTMNDSQSPQARHDRRRPGAGRLLEHQARRRDVPVETRTTTGAATGAGAGAGGGANAGGTSQSQVAPVDLTKSGDSAAMMSNLPTHRLLRLRQLRRQGRVPPGHRGQRQGAGRRPQAPRHRRGPHRRARRPRIQPRARPEARRGGGEVADAAGRQRQPGRGGELRQGASGGAGQRRGGVGQEPPRRARTAVEVMRATLGALQARRRCGRCWSRRSPRRRRTPASSTTTRRAGRSSTCASSSSRATSSSARARPSRSPSSASSSADRPAASAACST